jgi:hypothetical protein
MNFRIVEDTTLWQRPIRDGMGQATVSSDTWRRYMARQTCPYNCRTYRADNKTTHPGYGSRADSGR